MSGPLSPNTQAILLMTGPLLAGRGSPSERPLSAGEYQRLAIDLRQLHRQPAELLTPDAEEILRQCPSATDRHRVLRLLERGFLLSQAIERWNARAIWIISRADNDYPRRLKARLKEAAPAVLYGCGERSLLETGGLAVVGSRHVDDELIEYTMSVGRLAAKSQVTVVSGGARGIDRAAMNGALEAGGKVAGVLGDSLEKAATHRENRIALLDQKLVLVTPYDPGAGFTVGHAMQRNKLVYALADAALVVNSDINKGGTWAGATEQLETFHFGPLYIRTTGVIGKGLEALQRRGALAWPNPTDSDALASAIRRPQPTGRKTQQNELQLRDPDSLG